MGNTPGTRFGGFIAGATLGLAVLVLAFGLAIQVARGDDSPPEAGIDAVIKRMKHAYDGKEGLQATFVQTNTGASYFEPLVMKGTLALKKPRRIRMAYLTPRPKTYLSDGATLWIIDDGDRTVSRSTTQTEAVGRMFDFLTGVADVRGDFTVQRAAGAEPAEGFDVLQLDPRSPDAGIARVLVRVHGETGLVHAVVTVTPFGDRSETVLSDLRTDVALLDADFAYKAREGFRVVDLD